MVTYLIAFDIDAASGESWCVSDAISAPDEYTAVAIAARSLRVEPGSCLSVASVKVDQEATLERARRARLRRPILPGFGLWPLRSSGRSNLVSPEVSALQSECRQGDRKRTPNGR
jgi:hypothetical protein